MRAARLLATPPLIGLRAVSLFILREDSGCCGPKGDPLYARVTKPMPVRDNLPHSKSMAAPVSCKKSVDNRTAASVGSSRTKNLCLNWRPYNSKETECRPLISRASPVTPYVIKLVTLTSHLDTPGCTIEMFEPISNINLLIFPCYSPIKREYRIQTMQKSWVS